MPLRRTVSISVLTLLAVATLGAAPAAAEPAAAEPDRRERNEWRDRDDRHDRDRWRHRDRGRDHRWDDRHDRGRHRGHDRYDRRGRYDRRDRYDRRWERNRFDRGFRVPARIHSFRDYDRYHYGRIYHRGHRHHHPVLAFPHEIRGVVSYVPYAYCEGALFERGAFFYDGPRLSIRWSF